MSMFGAVDLSTLAPSKGAASGAGSEPGATPGVADSGVIDSPLVIDVAGAGSNFTMVTA